MFKDAMLVVKFLHADVGVRFGWQKRVSFFLLFLLVAFGGMNLFAQEKSDQPNLLKNGGFEDVRPVTEKELKPFQSLGWKVEGKLQLPQDWQLGTWSDEGYFEKTYRGGVIEVVEQPGEAKQGARCLRLSTSGSDMRTSVTESFLPKSGNTFSWSYWAKGIGGMTNFADPTKIAAGRTLQMLFEYQDSSGNKRKTIVPRSLDDARVSETWKQYSGVVTLENLKPESEVVVRLVAYQDSTAKTSTIWVDEFVVTAVASQPKDASAAATKSPEVKSPVQTALVSRADYRVADSWQIPAICGRTYWMLARLSWFARVNQKERANTEVFSGARDVLTNNCGGGVNVCEFKAPFWGNPQAPFFVTSIRWGTYGYAEEWYRKYGSEVPIPSVFPADPPPGVKTLKANANSLIEQYGQRYLGVKVEEWDNDIWLTMNPPPRLANADLRDKLVAHFGELGCAQVPPKTREQVAQCVETMFKVVKEAHGDQFFALTSTGINDHYALEFGSLIAAAEYTGQLGERVRFRIASTRGAARQYGKPWMSYMVNNVFSAFGGGCVSSSLFFRELIFGYIAGCSLYEQESDFADYLPDRRLWVPRGGYIEKLVCAMRYFNSDNDRGAPYTPILLGLDWLHAFDNLPPRPWNRYDAMIPKIGEALMPSHDKAAVMPDGNPKYEVVETNNYNMANSSFGDVFDLMVLNPPSDSATLEKLNAYKVMVLLGEIRWTKKLAERVENYVKAGGTLFLAADQLQGSQDMGWCGSVSTGAVFESHSVCDKDGGVVAAMPEGKAQAAYELASLDGAEVIYADENKHPLVVRRPVGGGSVVMCLVPSMLDNDAKWHTRQVAPAALATLQRLHDESLPFKIEGDVEFAVNRGKSSWTVTLINNRGITKPVTGPTTVDPKQSAIVTVRPKVPVSSVSEMLTEEINNVARSEKAVNAATVVVPPGDVRILRFND